MFEELSKWFTFDKLATLFRIVFILLVGFPTIYFFSRWLRRFISKKFDPQKGMVVGKLLYWSSLLLLVLSVLKEAGFELTTLLGAAGIFGIAIGFASQTGISNVISGIFLIIERSFEVNDLIQINNTQGFVVSIDTLSIKLRTLDNQFIRIPNETIIKSEVINHTFFPIRRIDILLRVSFKENIDNVKNILLSIPKKNPLCLLFPKPAVFLNDFNNSAFELRFATWTSKENIIDIKFYLLENIKRTFEENQIDIQYQFVSIEPTGGKNNFSSDNLYPSDKP